MKYNHSLFAAVYLLLAGGALYLYVAFDGVSGLADLSVVGLGAIWLLTLPWSSVLIIFAWALTHSDASNPIFLLFFALCAVLNAYLINLVAGAVSRGGSSWRWKDKPRARMNGADERRPGAWRGVRRVF